MKSLIAKRVYIPYLSHKDNQTRRWKPIVFILDKMAKVRVGENRQVQIGRQLIQVKIEQKCGNGWFKCRRRSV